MTKFTILLQWIMLINNLESTKLTSGQHQWMVRSYLVEKRLYNSFQSNINLEKLISNLKFQQSNVLKEAGPYVYKNFGVL